VAKSVIGGKSDYSVGERIFHQKFGYGRISSIDGNKLTIDFEKAGQKRVLDSFVERH
jgi:DNA helicase-2/ATP-dependent DNA helicase PcrA